MAETGPPQSQIEFLNKATSEILIEFTISSLHELFKHSDHAKVYDISKKMIMEESISSTAFQMENVAKKKGIEAAIGPLYIAQSAIGGPDNIEVEMREKGAVGTIHDCPFKDAKPELCVIMSHVGSEVFCQLADPELECLWTHHMTDGDPFCRYVFKKKAVPYKDPDSLGNVLMKLPRVDLTDEQLNQYKKWGLATYWTNNTICFNMLHGSEKTNEILGVNAKRIGKNVGSTLIEANMLPARDIAVMGSLINLFGEGSAMRGSITSMALGVFAKEITDCPFKNAPPEICKQFESFFNGVLEKINPELEYHYDRMMTMGDKTCKWVITKKEV